MFSRINHPKSANLNQFDSISQPSDWGKRKILTISIVGIDVEQR